MSFNTMNNTNNTMKKFTPFFYDTSTIDTVMSVLLCIVSFCVISGNLLVLLSFRVNRRLRTKTNYFILSLAFADLLIGILSVPYYVHATLEKKTSRNDDFYIVWITMDIIIGVSSIMNLTMISLERAYALLRPIEHRNISKVTIIVMAVVAWMLGILAGTIINALEEATRQRVYGILVFSVFFAVPLTIIIVTYSIIFKIASAHARGRGVRSFKKDLRIATTIAVVIGFFTINWLPFFSLNLFFAICRDYGVMVCRSVPYELYHVVKLMQYGNSFCNPIIYGFRNKDFKVTFKKIIYKMACKEVAISSYKHSTYTTRNTRRVVRTESSFDDSMVYPDQMVPTGMYDMRDSYRNAISRGPRKKPAKNNNNNSKQRKGLAQGLMALNVETFSMQEHKDGNDMTSQTEFTSDNNITSQTELSSANNIASQPSDDNTDVNKKQAENINCKPTDKALDIIAPDGNDEGQSCTDIQVYPVGDTPPHDKTNGLINGGLCNDDSETVHRDKSFSAGDDKDSSHLVPADQDITKRPATKPNKNVSFT